MWTLAFPLALLLLPLPLLAARLLPPRARGTGALLVPPSIGARMTAGGAPGVAARTRRLLPALLWCLLVLALAGPERLGTVEALPAEGRDLVLAMDLSGSMEKEDFELDGAPVSRLDAVKRVAAAFVRGRAGDRVGLVIFGETAYFAAPPTFDTEAVAKTIEAASIGISGRSTAIADGLGLALKRLSESRAPSRVVILLSDGVNNAGAVAPTDAGSLAARLGVRVHTIALGPKDLESNPTERDVVDAATLRAISEASGGTTFRVRTMADLVGVTQAIDALETDRAARPPVAIREPFWTWPACAALLLALGLVLFERRLAA
ncbi:VWA domain-containing protein [Aurantimonas sp. Leaf443]|uniref:VWA domain-containing protein n=1 Tax=Aurantimonas sp. Leaf443 TaxID=1736378 RepID=UPI000700318D|nr:VWA domain-containing protein [Aurantimonas sp. Leaf443]KQT82187.1 hypothetical protein ASG48_16240 [Aurantimonas sp. Leaf443]